MASVDQSALTSRIPISISQLRPDLPESPSNVVQGEITITWPYSAVTRTFAFLLAERDVRLRRKKGQVRVELRGSSAKAASESGIGGGDEILLSLDGAHFAQDQTPARPPGSRVDWQLEFAEKLILQAKIGESGEKKLITIDHPRTEDEAQANIEIPAHTPEPQEETRQPVPASAPVDLLTSRTGDLAPSEFQSPAFLKRDRLSYGSLYEGGFDPFEEDGGVKGQGRKRARVERFSAVWRYTSRSPSPETQRSKAIQADENHGDEDVPEAEASSMVSTPTKARGVTDQGSQNLNRDMASPVPAATVFGGATTSQTVQSPEIPTSDEVQRPSAEPEAQKQEEGNRSTSQQVPTGLTTLFGNYAPHSGDEQMSGFASATGAQEPNGLSISDRVRFPISHEPQTTTYKTSTISPNVAAPIPVSGPGHAQTEAYPSHDLGEHVPTYYPDPDPITQTGALHERQTPEHAGYGYAALREHEPVNQGPWGTESQSAYPEPRGSVNFGFGTSAVRTGIDGFPEDVNGSPEEMSLGHVAHWGPRNENPARHYGSDMQRESSNIAEQDHAIMDGSNSARDSNVELLEQANIEGDGDELGEDDYDPRSYNVREDDDEGLSAEKDEMYQEDRDRYGDPDIYEGEEDEEDEYDEYEDATGLEPYSDMDDEESQGDQYEQPQGPTSQQNPVVIDLISDSDDSDDADDDDGGVDENAVPPDQSSISVLKHETAVPVAPGFGMVQSALHSDVVDFAQPHDSMTTWKSETNGDQRDKPEFLDGEDEEERDFDGEIGLDAAIDAQQDPALSQAGLIKSPVPSRDQGSGQGDYEDDEDGEGDGDDVVEAGSDHFLEDGDDEGFEDEDMEDYDSQMEGEYEEDEVENDVEEPPAANQEPDVIVLDSSSDDEEEPEDEVEEEAEDRSLGGADGNETDETAKDVELARSDLPTHENGPIVENDENAMDLEAAPSDFLVHTDEPVVEIHHLTDIIPTDSQVDKASPILNAPEKNQLASDIVPTEIPQISEPATSGASTVSDSKIPNTEPEDPIPESDQHQFPHDSGLFQPELPNEPAAIGIVRLTSVVAAEAQIETQPTTHLQQPDPDQEMIEQSSEQPVQANVMEEEQLRTPHDTRPSVFVEETIQAEMMEIEAITADTADGETMDTDVVETEIIETLEVKNIIDAGVTIVEAETQPPPAIPDGTKIDPETPLDEDMVDTVASSVTGSGAPDVSILQNVADNIKGNSASDQLAGSSVVEGARTDQSIAIVGDESVPSVDGEEEVLDEKTASPETAGEVNQTTAHKAVDLVDSGDADFISLAEEDDKLEVVAPEPLIEEPTQEGEEGENRLEGTSPVPSVEDLVSIPSPSAQLRMDMEEASMQQVTHDGPKGQEHAEELEGDDMEEEEEDQSQLKTRDARVPSKPVSPRRLRSSARTIAASSPQESSIAMDVPEEPKGRSSRRTTASPPRDAVQEEITVQPAMTRARSQAVKAPASQASDGKALSRDTSPDISVSLARQSIAANQRKKVPEPVRTSPRATRGRVSSEQLSAHNEADSSIQLARAALASPTNASFVSTEGEVETKTTTLRTELIRRRQTELHECVSLATLKSHIDQQTNIVGIVTMRPNPPTRANSGPREFMFSFFITDPAAVPAKGATQVIEVLMYRPHKDSLPTLEPGDAVLLQNFKVRSLAKKGYGLQSHSDSAWAVWDSASDNDDGLPSIKGPPVEDWQNYADYMRQLKEWWASLDELTRQKIDRANKKMDEVNHPK